MRTTSSWQTPDQHAWIAVRTQAHREPVAIANLERQGFPVYCPRFIRRIKHARTTKDVLRPLFPGYLFVEIEAQLQRWRSIRSTVGVSRIVHFGNVPGYLSPDFIATLRGREIEGAVARPTLPWTIGQSVQIAGGPFDGLIARIIELGDKERLIVLMDLLSQSVKVRLEGKQVAPFSPT